MRGIKKILPAVLLALMTVFALCGCGTKYDTTISLASGTYIGAQEVTLSNVAGAPIYYTLDGSKPSEDSLVYNKDKPLVISFDSTLRAVTIDNGTMGPVAEAEYVIKEETKQKLSETERFFITLIGGSYELNGNTLVIDSSNKTITWNINGDQGSSSFTVSCPEGSSESGVLTYTGSDGKEHTYNVDMAPDGDGAVYFNEDNWIYVG